MMIIGRNSDNSDHNEDTYYCTKYWQGLEVHKSTVGEALQYVCKGGIDV